MIKARTRGNKHIPNSEGQAPVCSNCAKEYGFFDVWGESYIKSCMPCYLCNKDFWGRYWVTLPERIIMIEKDLDFSQV